ncbi:hypothetical protein GUJ93_ZPchr0182g2746 [Zizania palustris]|uniref:Uncharacterized protein n=1 Tax=Zizania palustris TaxID=103762 RepID=A0A8J5QXK2_ZIZPA|nr:hypothetical protein GUJ93_ZPchr0182g2746 [Zizania palustris]
MGRVIESLAWVRAYVYNVLQYLLFGWRRTWRRLAGWRRTRIKLRQSYPPKLSANISLAHSLSKALAPTHPILFLLVSPSSANLSTHSCDHRAFLLISPRLVPVSLDVANVGPCFRDQYHSFVPGSTMPWLPLPYPSPSTVGDTRTSGEQNAVDGMVDGFGLGKLEEVVGSAAGHSVEMEDMYAGMLRRLEKLAREVEKSNLRVLKQDLTGAPGHRHPRRGHRRNRRHSPSLGPTSVGPDRRRFSPSPMTPKNPAAYSRHRSPSISPRRRHWYRHVPLPPLYPFQPSPRALSHRTPSPWLAAARPESGTKPSASPVPRACRTGPVPSDLRRTAMIKTRPGLIWAVHSVKGVPRPNSRWISLKRPRPATDRGIWIGRSRSDRPTRTVRGSMVDLAHRGPT